MTARVVGIGQRFAGDDAVGLMVADRLRALAPEGVEVFEVDDASNLIDLLERPGTVVLVDALVGGAHPGQIHMLRPEALERGGLQAFSTHGFSVQDAVSLARVFEPSAARPWIVGIEIVPPVGPGRGLSPEVRGAVDSAVEMVLALARAEDEHA